METADIMSKELNLPIIKSEDIEEMDAGILSGMDKRKANSVYPNYYKIWRDRQDLDEIPNAESGENLQARVIGFLMRYYDEPDFCDIIVSHAGFIRCLINTIENRNRTSQFNIENSSFFSIDNIFENMSIQKRERAMNSKVLIITTADGKYVAKLKKGIIGEQDYAEQSLLRNMQGDNIPKVLSLQEYNDGKFCKVIKYVEGKHIYGPLREEEYKALIESEKRLKLTLGKVKGTQFFRINDLRKKLEMIYQDAQNPYIKLMVKKLLKSKYCTEIENVGSYVLSHDDLNRDNILFETTESGETRANIIDFESLELAPQDFQFASMLASGLLLEGESIQRLKETIHQNNMDLGKILFFMQIRTLEGLYFFQEQSNEYVSSNEAVSRQLLKKYFYSSEIIQNEIENIKTQEGEEPEQ